MKSAMPYHGITAPRLKQALRPILAAYAPADRATWEDTVRELWDGATHREERYAATALARHRAARAWQDPPALDLYRHLVVTGAWWDHVDEVASHLVGGVLAGHRPEVTPVMRAWARDDDLWVRRTAVLSQVGHQGDTDTDLLHDVVEANLDDRSFWLRKAIGWALREYSKTDPEWVRAEVDLLGERLSGLSRREATRRLAPN
jgi:3-methyladenine DNA glycosylase AlkD